MTDCHKICQDLDAVPMRTPRQRYMADLEEIARAHFLPLRLILSPDRTAMVVECRTDCIKWLRREYKMPIRQIGRIMNRHHSTIHTTLAK